MESFVVASAEPLWMSGRARRQPRSRGRQLAAFFIATLLIASCSGTQGNDRWSALPHTMGCTDIPVSGPPDPDPNVRFEPLPEALRVEQVTVTHQGSARVVLSLQFLHQPPAPPRSVRSPIDGSVVNAPGSISYGVVVHHHDDAISIDSPTSGKGWDAGSFSNDRPVPVSATTSGSTVTITLDLETQQDFLGSGPFKPYISVFFFGVGQLNPTAVAGFPMISYQGQDCKWDTPRQGASDTQPSQVPAATNPPPVALPAPTVRSDPEADDGWTESHPPTGSFVRFQSATGNIACEIGGAPGEGTAVCEVREHTYRPEVKSDCNPGWVNSFALLQGQAPVVNCYRETVFRGSLPVQAYGRPLTAGSITCSMDKDTGVTCKDSSTGHYFQAARQEYRWR